MVNPVGDTNNQHNVPINGSVKHRDLLQEKGNLSQINVSLSGKSQELKLFESHASLAEGLKKEFDEVFEFGNEKKNSFLKKLDHISMSNKI